MERQSNWKCKVVLALTAIVAGLALAPGCAPTQDHDRGSDSDSDSDGDSDADSDADGDTDTDTGSETETDTGNPIDCDAVPDVPISVTELEHGRGRHGLAFDEEGFIVGTDGASLLKISYVGGLVVFAPGMGSAEGMDYLPDGDLVVSNPGNSSLSRIDPTGQTTVIANDNNAYGVNVGPDGLVYVGNNSQLYRVDPSTGDIEVLTDMIPARCSEFSPDLSRLYITTLSQNGNIYVMDLDDDLNPIGNPVLFATIAGGGWLDGLGVDACGNLFVPDYNTSSLYRITPEGLVSLYYYFGSVAYGHGLAWGSGMGGWNAEALYLPQPYDENTVVEVVIGVPEA